MHPRILKSEIDKIKQVDGSQENDIDGLKENVGEVPSGEGNDLQSQVTALTIRVQALEDAAQNNPGE